MPVTLDMPLSLYDSPAIIMQAKYEPDRVDKPTAEKDYFKLKTKKEKGYTLVLSWCQDVGSNASIDVLSPVLKEIGYDLSKINMNKPYIGLPPSVFGSIKVSVLKAPVHGSVVQSSIVDSRVDAKTNEKVKYEDKVSYWDYAYNGTVDETLYPTVFKDGFHGYSFKGEKDSVVFQVEVNGKKYKEIVNFWVSAAATYSDGYSQVCATKKFSLNFDTQILIGENAASEEYNPPLDTYGGYLNYNNIINYTFRDLTGSAVGETTGEGANATITLDIDAAGHGWYIGGLTTEDRGQNLSSPSAIFNPLSSVFSPPSSDWLPTSNPNEWVARAGTDAAGKMDMLSVLLHEYGHALGIDHSSDSHDYMGTTLTPGMRRLPSGEEMQLMALLAAEAREAILAGNGYTLTVANNNTDSPTPSPTLPISMGFGISFLGLLRRNNGSAALTPTLSQGERGLNVAQYDIAANATLTNGNFSMTPTPTLPLEGGGSIAGWETTGKVNANNGAAILSEVSTSQTRLNQVFVVGADDRYLSFTLANIGLEGHAALTPTSALTPTPLPNPSPTGRGATK